MCLCASLAVTLKAVPSVKVVVEWTVFFSVLDLALCVILDAVRLALLG